MDCPGWRSNRRRPKDLVTWAGFGRIEERQCVGTLLAIERANGVNRT